jgi:hypothetical protein
MNCIILDEIEEEPINQTILSPTKQIVKNIVQNENIPSIKKERNKKQISTRSNPICKSSEEERHSEPGR